MHRRLRAVRRLSKNLGQLRLMNNTLQQYILPIITCFFKDQAYVNLQVKLTCHHNI